MASQGPNSYAPIQSSADLGGCAHQQTAVPAHDPSVGLVADTRPVLPSIRELGLLHQGKITGSASPALITTPLLVNRIPVQPINAPLLANPGSYPPAPVAPAQPIKEEYPAELLVSTAGRRVRRLEKQQINQLEQHFRQNAYPTLNGCKEIAATLNLSLSQVYVWFQNRRAKLRKLKQQRGEAEPSAEASEDSSASATTNACRPREKTK